MTFDTNVGGTVNVFEAARKTFSVKVLVSITSDKCYENKEWDRGFKENDPLGGQDPYSASKGCAELVFSAYLKSFFSQDAPQNRAIGAASVRAGNVIGGGDWGADRLIPDCIRALSGHHPISIRNPHSVRPWQHVLEPLGGYLLLGAALRQDPQKYSGPWNFGPDANCHLTVAKMADKLIEYWGDGSWEYIFDPQALHEAKLLKLNCAKAHSELNWRSSLTSEEGLRMTTDWYQRFYASGQKTDMYPFCVMQIRKYKEMASTKR